MAKKKTPKPKANDGQLEPVRTKARPKYVGLRSKIDIDSLDRRTSIARSLTALKESLREYVGENTPVSEIIIQRICYKTLRLIFYEKRMLENLESEESDRYLMTSNSLRGDVTTLMNLADKQRKPTTKGRDIAEIIDTFKGSI